MMADSSLISLVDIGENICRSKTGIKFYDRLPYSRTFWNPIESIDYSRCSCTKLIVVIHWHCTFACLSTKDNLYSN